MTNPNPSPTSTPQPKRAPWLAAGRFIPWRWASGALRSRSRLLVILGILGPGLIAANAGNDAGGIATYASVGAQYGYKLLWMIVLITVCLAIVQEMAARMGAITGKGLSDLIREQFGARWTLFAMLTILVSNGLTTISEFAGIAAALELFNIPKYVSVPVFAALIWYLVTQGSYHRVEKIFLALTTVFLAYIVTAFVARPNWGDVFTQMIHPTIQFDSQYILLFVATVGTTITPYMQLFQQSEIVEKGITAATYAEARIDTLFGVFFSDIITFFIVVATGATLFGKGIEVNSAADAAKALQPLAGHYATVLFAVGLFGASMLAAGVLPLATAFSVCEAFGWESGVSKRWEEARAFYTLFTVLIGVGALVTLIPGLPLFQLLVIVQAVNGVLLPVILLFMMKLVNDREVMGEHVNGRVFNLAAWATTGLMCLLAATLIVTSVIFPLVGINLGG